jgi:acyl-CoA reductase-like NAD-dependent aldehyde dehydrogenase
MRAAVTDPVIDAVVAMVAVISPVIVSGLDHAHDHRDNSITIAIETARLATSPLAARRSRRRRRRAFAAAAEPGERATSQLACLGDEHIGGPVVDHAIGGLDRMRRICERASVEPDRLDERDR